MPLPSPEKGQSEKNFISDCMSDTGMKEEFTNIKQRFAVCKSQHKMIKKTNGNTEDIDWLDTINSNYIIW